MRWLPWRRKKEARESIQEAMEARQQVQAQQAEVEEATSELRARRQHNEFRRSIQRAFKGETHA